MRTHYVLAAALLLCACATSDASRDTSAVTETVDTGAFWTEHAAEYRAVSTQVYAQARRDLPRLLGDTGWTALPGQRDVEGKPPAVILDVDETVVSNADYQKTLAYAPYTPYRHFDWMRNNRAVPIRGAAETIEAARALGITVFFVTNRACETFEGVEGDCPAEQVTIDDLREAGIEADADRVLMAWERPGWSKEKLHRREHIARTHRVIMLFGDDYGDFVACARAKPLPPCKAPATRASRHAALDTYERYWGNGWYVLPNPMHGSWTTVR